jgi:hypothetical protein
MLEVLSGPGIFDSLQGGSGKIWYLAEGDLP